MIIPRLIAICAVALSSLASAVPVITEVVASPAPTAGGSTVIIRGLTLGAVNFVSIGGSSADINFVTHDTIICAAPPGQGRNVSVQVFEGPNPSNIVSTFAYDIPRVSNFNVNSSPTLGGGTLTIAGSNFRFLPHRPHRWRGCQPHRGQFS
ncbi:MAG: IPT/TIG domain-containing protein [Planctomycetes bacterium]|nr:IPT/TIG domain-containing protein [Planctomycetota bacterium]